MNRQALKQVPLVEAIFEVRWSSTPPAPNGVDPHYRLLLGRFYDRVQNQYPAHHQLPAALLPDDMVMNSAQHWFRKSENGWPLIQMGPGILSLNETSGYEWTDFRKRCIDALSTFWQVHPKPENLRIESIALRYINSVDFDHSQSNVYDFLRDSMKVGAGMPPSLFASTPLSARPIRFVSQSTFQSTKPKGLVSIQFDTGYKNEKVPVLRWECSVIAAGADIPPGLPASIESWIDEAHLVQEACFESLVPATIKREEIK